MEETKITEEVKAPEEAKTPEVEESKTDSSDILDEPYITNPFFYELTNYFGIEQGDFEETKNKLSVIADWAYKEAESKEPGDILLKLRELENSIQPAEWGEKRYNNVYRYLRLAMQKQSLEKSMKAFEKESK
jgi:hypothetical protein